MSLSPREEIYVTLPSNVSNDLFKDNKPSSFKTKLRIPLQLEGEWEAALIDIQYPHKWNNFVKGCDIYFLIATIDEVLKRSSLAGADQGLPQSDQAPSVHAKESAVDSKTMGSSAQDEKEPSVDTVTKKRLEIITVVKKLAKAHPEKYGKHMLQFTVPAGYYPTFLDVANYIANKFSTLVKFLPNAKMVVDYDSFRKRINFKVIGCEAYLFSQDDYLMQHLGYIKNSDIVFMEISLCEYFLYDTGAHEPYLDDNTTIYVYSDLIEYQLVGNTQVPLMGVLPIQGDHGKQLYWNFNPPYYIPVCRAHVADIEIQLCTATGKILEILDGDVICRLHFRKRFLSHTI